ncbi:hypothetical protein [Clostridium sp.]|uniref:hypothetical protein n=1 Tax=Clostridium sp. TaxID=1506 RepID=UPI002FDEB2C7
MLLGLVEKTKNYFVGKTLDGSYIKINNFQLDEDIEVGALIEVDLQNLDYNKMDKF